MTDLKEAFYLLIVVMPRVVLSLNIFFAWMCNKTCTILLLLLLLSKIRVTLERVKYPVHCFRNFITY